LFSVSTLDKVRKVTRDALRRE